MINVGDTVIVHSDSMRHKILEGTKVLVVDILGNGKVLNVMYKNDKGIIITRYVHINDAEKEFRDDTKLGELL